MRQDYSQLPSSLNEALGATPLTFLVPTQNLASITEFNEIELPIESEMNTLEFSEYSKALRVALESENPKYDELKKTIKGHLSMSAAVQNSKFSFNALNDLRFVDDASDIEDSSSLFKGLKGLSRAIIDEAPLIRENQLKTSNQVGFQLKQTTEANIGKTVEATPLSLNPKKHHQPDQEELADPQVKKRKSEIGVQHLQLENMSLNKLNNLVMDKIMLRDEDSEYESSDLWIEWKNSSHSLSDFAIVEVERYLTSVLESKLISQVSFEVLERIEILCTRSISNAGEMEWESINDTFTMNHIPYAHNALKAISLMLEVLNSKRPEKKLYLDYYLAESLSFLNSFIEDFIIKILAAENVIGKEVIIALHLIEKIFSKLCRYVPSNKIDDTMITKLEYLTILILFSQCDKSLMFFKTSSLSLLISIFQSKADQRLFIVNEVLNNFEKLPIHRVNARQIKTRNGVNIQFFTVILLNLIQCLNLSTISYTNDIEGDDSKYNSKSLESLKENERFSNSVSSNKQERVKIVSTISSIITTQVINNPSHSIKQQFELLIVDLLNVVTLPEWYASSELLTEIMQTIMFLSGDQVSSIETHFLEMVGLIGSKMLEIKGSSDIQNASISSLTLSCKTVLEYLLSLRRTVFFESTYDFFFTSWIEGLSSNELKANHLENSEIYYKLLAGRYQGKKNDLFAFGEIDPNSLETMATSSFHSILMITPFMNLYDSFLNHLLKSVDNPKIKSKTRALKNLALLISEEDSLMEVPQIKQSLIQKITDSSALVKLAALDIFEQYISNHPGLVPDFHQVIVLATDKSTAIRMKSIRIAKKMIWLTKDNDIKVSLLERILRRIEDDEENVIELSKSVLTDLIFTPLLLCIQDEQILNMTIKGATKLVVTLVNKSQKNWDLFESFLFGDIIRKKEENIKIHDDLMKVCFKIVDDLFLYLVDNMDTAKQNEVEDYLGLLSIFSKSDILFINQEQLLSLQTYLTSDQSNGKVSYYSLVILRNTLYQTTALRDQFITTSLSSLLKKLTKLNSKELDQALPCIWSLSEMKQDTTKVATAAASCLSLIKPYVEKAIKNELPASADPKLLRLMFLIGSFGKYCDLERNRTIFLKIKSFQLKDNERILSLITKTIMVFIKDNINRQTRRVAVRNLIQICSNHPKLFTNDAVLKALDDEVLKPGNLDFKEVIIQGLLEFLEKEEKDSIKKIGNGEKLSAKVGLDVDVFHGNAKSFENDGICASLVQRYTEPILDVCLKTDGGISYLGVRFLKFIVKLGFANPRACITTVIALEASPIPSIRNTALELHRELHEKHESLVATSYFKGIKLAAEFRVNVSTDITQEDIGFLGRLYKVIENSKGSRKKVFSQLTKYLNFSASGFQFQDYKTLNSFLIFLGPNLSQIDFDTYENVLELIGCFDTVIHRYNSSVAEELANLKGQDLNSTIRQNNEKLLNTCYQAVILINLERILANMKFNYRYNDLNLENLKDLRSKLVKATTDPKSTVILASFDPSEAPFELIIEEFERSMSRYSST